LGDYAACTGTTGYDTIHLGNLTTLPNGAFRLGITGRGVRLAEITDGASNTILIGEKHVMPTKFGQAAGYDCSIYDGATQNGYCSQRALGGVTSPGVASYPLATSINDTNWRFGSYHTNFCMFVFADGHVQAIPVTTDPQILEYLANIAD